MQRHTGQASPATLGISAAEITDEAYAQLRHPICLELSDVPSRRSVETKRWRQWGLICASKQFKSMCGALEPMLRLHTSYRVRHHIGICVRKKRTRAQGDVVRLSDRRCDLRTSHTEKLSFDFFRSRRTTVPVYWRRSSPGSTCDPLVGGLYWSSTLHFRSAEIHEQAPPRG